MNIHHVTDLIENSIRLLDEEVGGDDAFCADVRTLYDFQATYSTSVTYFRVMEVLVRRGYFLEVPLEDHPEWSTYQSDLEALDPDAVSPLLEDPIGEWDEDDNPVVGYVKDGEIYVEAGTPLADALADSGAVTDAEAARPEPAELTKAVADAARAADARGDEDTLLLWYTNLSFHVVMQDGDASDDELLAELKADPHIGELRELVGQFDDLEMKLGHPDCPAEPPPYMLREKHPVLKWWYGV